jgi:hypothetical protein
MNHKEAIESEACERYLLGELPAELCEQYEEHYFSCSECSAELRLAAEFLGSSRRTFAEAPALSGRPDGRPARGWFRWMNPLVVAPVLAALLLFIAYQNLVTIPRYKHSAAPEVLPMYSLLTANTRGDQGLVFSVEPGQPFGLYVDVPVDPAYSTYLLRLESPGGASVPLRSLSSSEAQKTQVITVNPGRQAGSYALVISGLASGSAPANSRELARLQFTVALKD